MIIKNVKVINFDQVIENADVEIENGLIKVVSPKVGKGKKILVPGFIDHHLHGFASHDVADGEEATNIIAKELSRRGTTGFLPTLITADVEAMLKRAKEIAKAKNNNQNILGIHFEGPFVSKIKKGAHDENFIVEATKKDLERLIKETDIKKITIAPENFDIKLVELLTDNNVIASIGHSNVSAADARKYIDAGVTSGTHLWNAMSGVANRNPGIVEEALINPKIYAELIIDLFHVDPQAIDLTIKSKGIDGIIAVTDAIKPAYSKDGKYFSGGLPIEKKGKKITLENSDTIAGSGICMHDCFLNLVELGYTYKEAVQLTSYNPARFLKRNDLGQIKKGKRADLVLMNETHEIEQVYLAGKMIDLNG